MPRGVPTKEAAQILGMKEGTLWKWASTGSGPLKPHRVGRSLRWPENELRRLVGAEVA